VGVEPTSNCFAGSCLAIWLQRQELLAEASNQIQSLKVVIAINAVEMSLSSGSIS
jgi:hypothetical protein